MVNTPPEQRVQLSPPEPAQPRRPQGQCALCHLRVPLIVHDTDGDPQMWRRIETFMSLMPDLRRLLEGTMNPTQLLRRRRLRWPNCTTIAWPQIGIPTWLVPSGLESSPQH
jgi:hypothetical protein